MVDQKRERELNDALELFYFAYRSFTAGPDRMLASRGLQRMHHRILYFVGRNPGLSVGDLLGILAVSKQAVNAPLRQLTELGLVETATDARDRRIKRLSLSHAGARLERRLSGSQRDRLGSLFGELGARPEADWREVMARIAEETPGRGGTA